MENPPHFGEKRYAPMPMSGMQTIQPVRFSLLYHQGEQQWTSDGPVVEIVGGGRKHRLTLARAGLAASGFGTPKEAAEGFASELPQSPRHALSEKQAYRPTSYRDPEDPRCHLLAALILGRCVDGVFDPVRPHIWTETRLARKVVLFKPRGFYDK